jgi:hypothetical protein
MQSAALAGITTESAGDPINFGISTALRPSSLLFRGDVAAQVCFFSAVSGGGKFDSCGGRKSDSRQHGLAAG